MPEQTTYWVLPVISNLKAIDHPNYQIILPQDVRGVMFVYTSREAAARDNPGHEHLIMKFETIGET